MSNPLLFFIIVIVIDLVLKSARDKKKIEKSKEERERELQNKPDLNKQEQMEKPESVRGLMSTLREQIEKERLRELERRQEKTVPKEVIKTNVEREMTKKTYEDKEYWEVKRKEEKHRKEKEISTRSKVEKREGSMKEDLIRGIIFSEILSEPKSIKNQKRSM